MKTKNKINLMVIWEENSHLNFGEVNIVIKKTEDDLRKNLRQAMVEKIRSATKSLNDKRLS